MSATLTFEGLDELYAELKALPEIWKAAAMEAARGTAEMMARAVRAAYATQFKAHTGDLTKDIRVEQLGPLTFVVVNRARHAHLLEFGTVSRFTHDTGAARGRIEQRPVFIPLAVKYRRQLFERIKLILEAFGARVVGTDASLPLLGAVA